jgi:hypothetical protein
VNVYLNLLRVVEQPTSSPIHPNHNMIINSKKEVVIIDAFAYA